MKHYCSECEWAKYYETASSLKIVCTRPRIRENTSVPNHTATIFSIYKHINATSCLNFKAKTPR